MSNDFNQDTVEQLYPMLGAAGAAGAIAGAWVSMENFGKCGVLVSVDDASEELTFSLDQATDTSGTDEKTLQVRRVWARLGAETTYTLVSETAADTYVLAAASGTSDVVIEVDENDLDVNNDFVAFQVDIAGSTARTQQVTYLLRGPGYKKPTA